MIPGVDDNLLFKFWNKGYAGGDFLFIADTDQDSHSPGQIVSELSKLVLGSDVVEKV